MTTLDKKLEEILSRFALDCIDETSKYFKKKTVNDSGLEPMPYSKTKQSLKSLISEAIDEVIGDYSGSDLVLRSNQTTQHQRKLKILGGGSDE